MSNSNQRDNSAEPQNNFRDLEVQKIYYPHYTDLWQTNHSNKTILLQRRKNEPETALTFSYCVVTAQISGMIIPFTNKIHIKYGFHQHQQQKKTPTIK